MQIFNTHVPQIVWRFSSSNIGQSIENSIPRTFSVAFELGYLSALYTMNLNTGSDIFLEEAAVLQGRPNPLTAHELKGMLELLREVDQHRGVAVRLRGFFTFVNIM